VIYNSAATGWRPGFCGLLAYGNANDIVWRWAARCAGVKHTGAGRGDGNDPSCCATVPARAARAGLRGIRIPHRRADRRVFGQPGGNRDGLRAGGRADRGRRAATCSHAYVFSRDARAMTRRARPDRLPMADTAAIWRREAKTLDDWSADRRLVGGGLGSARTCWCSATAAHRRAGDAAHVLRAPSTATASTAPAAWRLPTERALTEQTDLQELLQ